MQAARQAVASQLDQVNQLIIDHLHSDVGMVESIGHYIVDAGGKRMRPILVLLSANSLAYTGKAHISLAAVIEFIHTATLLHDDVVDLSNLRRGRPTANANWGNAPSVLVGDFLYTRAFQLMVAIGNMDVLKLMANTTNRIAEGEVLQLELAGNPDCSEQDYNRVIENKTAILFSAATEGAAIIAAADRDHRHAARDYGLHLGMAFQLIDDVLDYEGNAVTMGKNVGDDLAEGKPTLPLIYAMREGSASESALIRSAIEQKSADSLDDIVDIVQKTGALSYTREQALWHRQQSLAALSRLPAGNHREQMARLAELAINRDH
jgi:octaprenyl-diphosphate synthase